MLRAHVVSDIHRDLEFNDWLPPDVDCDLVICAGDAQQPLSLSLPWLRKAWPHHPILYVAGNHDYYSDHRHPDTKTTYEWQRANSQRIAEQYEINWLDDSGVTIDGTRFLGSTIWTGFDCRPSYMTFPEAQRSAMRMNDYRLIKVGRGRTGDVFKPKDSIDAHKVAVKWLTAQLAAPHAGETVVITHTAPSPKSLMDGKVSRDLDWCYASDLEYLMHFPDEPEAVAKNLAATHEPPSLWIHGHVHSNHDYVVGGTRVLCNARGYPRYFAKNAPRENPGFIEDLVIEIGRELTPTMRM